MSAELLEEIKMLGDAIDKWREVEMQKNTHYWYDQSEKPVILDYPNPVFPDYRELINAYWKKTRFAKSCVVSDFEIRTEEERENYSTPVWYHRITAESLSESLKEKIESFVIFEVCKYN